MSILNKFNNWLDDIGPSDTYIIMSMLATVVLLLIRIILLLIF